MPLPGGASDKYGNRYEGRWTVSRMIKVMSERADAIRIEVPGKEGEGAEFRLNCAGRAEYHQVKRQHSARGHWTLGDMQDVLIHFHGRLSDPQARCVFVSTQSADELRELGERARSSASWDEYERKFLTPKNHRAAFAQLCGIWGCSPDFAAYERLKRIEVRTVDESTLREMVEMRLAPLVEGEPETVVDVLAQLALDSVHQELTAHEIWHHLQQRGYSRRDWGNDVHVLAQVERANALYLEPLQEETIAGRMIRRVEAEVAMAALSSATHRRSVLLSGEAGVGKSVIALQIVERLRKAGTPVLAFRIDRLQPQMNPDDIGRQLGLPGSPPNVLAAVAKGRDSVLVIDQLDAVSLASGRNPQFFDCVNEMIRQAQRQPGMYLLLACRKFDLENDHRLRRLTGKHGIADEVSAGRLSREVIGEVLGSLGLDPSTLNDRQWNLLSLPLHLSMLSDVAGAPRQSSLRLETAKQLHDLFWDRKRDLIRERLGHPVAHWVEVIDALCGYMSANQVLSAPDSILDAWREDAQAMASEHVLARDRGRYAFFHESFFDYSFARRFASRGQDIIELLRADEQHLFRRAQVRQLLLHERDTDRARYLADLTTLLTSEGIRFHIKQVVFALLRQLQDPTPEEWDILRPLILEEDGTRCSNLLRNPLARSVWGTIYGSAPWFQLGDATGHIIKWLQEDERTLDDCVRLLAGVQEAFPERVVELFEANATDTVQWRRRAEHLLSLQRAWASRALFELLLRMIDRGMLDDADFWHLIYSLPEHEPQWACEAIGHYLARRLSIFGSVGQGNPFEGEPAAIPGSQTGVKILHDAASGDPALFTENVLPFMLSVLGITAIREKAPPWPDPLWSFRSLGRKYQSLGEAILYSLESALRALSSGSPGRFASVASQLQRQQFNATQFLLIRGYAANGTVFADEAASYLCDCPDRLRTGYGLYGGGGPGAGVSASRELVEAISPHCSDGSFRQLETTVLNYYTRWERSKKGSRSRGLSQFVLLSAMDSCRLSPGARKRLRELHRKFGDGALEPPRAMRVQTVGSPIPHDATERMTDEQWIGAIARYSQDDTRDRRDGRTVGGAPQLAELLESRTKDDPTRFGRLTLRLPDETNPVYFDRILRGLAENAQNAELILQVCFRCHGLPGRPCGQSICHALSKLAERPLPQEALDLTAWYATEDPDPREETWRKEAREGSFYYGGDVYAAGINSVRGSAAEALRDLIFEDGDLISHVKPTLERMVHDPSVAVRSCVAGTLLAVLKYEPRSAVPLFQSLCNTEDALLGALYVERFLYHALPKGFAELSGIVVRMLGSEAEGVQQAGARLACLASLGIGEALPLAQQCLAGTPEQRLGAAQVFSANVTHPAFRPRCVNALMDLFDDREESVRAEASTCFDEFEGEQLGAYVGLVEAFAASCAFSAHHEALIRAFEHSTAKLPDVTCTVCERLLDLLGPAIADVQARAALSGQDLWKLILRVYLTSAVDAMRSRCLDVIDRMTELGVYGSQDALAAYDR